jgi:CopG family nickel-responsive transcriptional regulator
MKSLTRFGISMEEDLLEQFDSLIARKGYTNRSEAVRDIVRATLVEEDVQSPDAHAFGALVFVYHHHQRELEKSLSNLQHEYFENIISTSHVHVDHDHCLEVVLLKGKAQDLRSIADRLLSIKGVEHGKLTLTPTLPHIPHRKHSHA